jgi:flagellar biosynthesis protein FlhG
MRGKAVPAIYPVAGGKGGIGKSFITANLGCLLAGANKTVLLSDFDLGSANLHTLLGIEDPGGGLNNFLNKTLPDLQAAIISCSVPGLSLLSARRCSLEAANLPYAQVQKIINAISRLPYDFILLDLGAGTHFNTLDFFLTSRDVILVFTQEPTSIESGVRFIETVYYRALKQLFKQHRINAILKDADISSTATLTDIVRLLISDTDDRGRDLLQCLGRFSFKLIINQARGQDSQRFGDNLLKLFRRHFYSRFELIGMIEYDPKIIEAVTSKQLFVKKYARSRITHDLTKIAKHILSSKSSPGHAPVKPFSDRNLYEILDVHPDTLVGKIRQEYQSISAIYRNNPVITEALFSMAEKNGILEKIDLAGKILSDPDRKRKYDTSLLNDKKNSPATYNIPVLPRSGKEDTGDEPAGDVRQAEVSPPENRRNPEVLNLQKKIGFQHVISGSDLKTLRTASGITVEHLFKKTRVGVSTLKNIEEDRFDDLPPLIYLKGFLRAYAQELQLPADKVVAGYLKNIEKKDRYRPEKPELTEEP